MAIFSKDLQKINLLNEKANKVNIKSHLLQFLNYQNESFNFEDIRFELNVNHRKQFEKNREFISNIQNLNSNYDFLSIDEKNKKIKNLTDIFLQTNQLNKEIFKSTERIIYQINLEEDAIQLFTPQLSSQIDLNFNEKQKELSFDLLHSFLKKHFILLNLNNLNNSSFELISNESTIYKNLDLDSFKNMNKFNIFKKIINDDLIKFSKNYLGFNFINTVSSEQNKSLISNSNKSLSLHSLVTSLNNIINNSFDYSSCNSLFKGIYTEDELSSKKSYFDITNSILLEHDINKELLPLKYIDNFDLITKNNINTLISSINLGLILSKNDSLQDKKENIKNDIFQISNFVSNQENNDSITFTSIFNKVDSIMDLLNLNNETGGYDEGTTGWLQPNHYFLNQIGIDSNKLYSISVKQKTNYFNSLNLISNHLNSNQLKLVYGKITNEERRYNNFKNLKYRNVLDKNSKGLLNYQFEDNNDFTSSIIKTRLICNNIVKKFKKIKLNNNLDASQKLNQNKINFMIDENSIRSNISKDIKLNNILDSVSNINNSQNFLNFLTNTSYFNDISNFFNNKPNINLFVDNENRLLGENNIPPNSKFLSFYNNINDLNTDPEFLKIDEDFKIKFENIKNFADEYYHDNLGAFKNSTALFEKLNELSAKNILWFFKEKEQLSEARADLLNTSSILWMFNDYCKESTEIEKEEFQNNFINYLIAYFLINNKNLNQQLKNSYDSNLLNFMINKGPNINTINEIAPFFTFFNQDVKIEDSNTISKNKVLHNSNLKNEYYNVTENIFETSGRFEHILSIPEHYLVRNNKLDKYLPHKMVDSENIFRHSKPTTTEKDRRLLTIAGKHYFKWKRENNPTADIYIPYIGIPQLNQYYDEGFKLFKYRIENIGLISNDDFPESEQIYLDFNTRNIFMNVMKFDINKDFIAEDALENNIFYQVVNLFKDLLKNINLQTNYSNINGLFNLLNDNTNNLIKDIKFLILNSLKITSKIYSKKFNTLQSYLCLSDRIFESNIFHENSLNQSKVKYKDNTELTFNDDYDVDLYHDYYYNLFDKAYYFDQNPFQISRISEDIWSKYTSLASKKMVYFLSEILGLNQFEIVMIMESLLCKAFDESENRDETGRYKSFNINPMRLTTQIISDNNLNINDFDQINKNELLCFENPFEMFNTYRADMEKLLNISITDQEIITSYTSNLSMFNFYYQEFFKSNITFKTDDYISYRRTPFISRDMRKIYRKRKNENEFYTNKKNQSYKWDEYSDSICLSPNNIFKALVASNFVFDESYQTKIQNDSRLSGLNHVTYEAGFLDIKDLINKVQDENFDLITNRYLDSHFVDINRNWYNHILYGLLTNDISLSLNIDLLLYYFSEKGLISKTKDIYEYLNIERNKKYGDKTLQESIDFLSNNTNINDSFFNLTKNNIMLQNTYLNSLIKYKSLQNIDDLSNEFNQSSQDDRNISLFLNKILNLNNQNENGDLIMSYFDDFYIKELYELNKTSRFTNEINKNYTKVFNNNLEIICNQSENILNSYYFTVGINTDKKLDDNDIISIKVEMIDHDFPEIVWEPKIFEFYNKFDDIEDIFFQYPELFSTNDIDNLNIQNPPIKISNYFQKDLLNLNTSISNINKNIKDSLIQYNNTTDNINLSNNINSITYQKINESEVYSAIQPLLYQNNVSKIVNMLITDKSNFISSKLNYDLSSLFTDEEKINISQEILKRCIHNQKLNLRHKKMLKLLTGFEPTTNISLKNNKDLKQKLIHEKIYSLFIDEIEDNKIFELYGFSKFDLENAIQKNQFSYYGNNFHIGYLSSNHYINIFLNMLYRFTQAVMPDFISFEEKIFQKVYNFSVNSKDFIVTGVSGVRNFIPKSTELKFEKIQNADGFSTFIDEIGTNPNLVLELISKYTEQRDDITYYHVYNKKDNSKYIPKNVSYRITTTILE